MKNNSRFLLPFRVITCYILFVFAVSACHHPKNISKTEPAKTVIQNPVVKPIDSKVRLLLKQLKNQEPEFKELAAKLKARVASSSINQSFTTNIRWKKGEKIWLSMSIIGIEGARVLITRDSIKIMDKINSRYIIKPLSFIKQKTLVDLSFTDIEKLLLGQLIFTDSTIAKYADNTSNITISADGLQSLTNVIFDKSTNNLSSIFVTNKMYSQTVESTYGNYQTQLGKSFSMDRNLKIRSGLETFEMDAKFQSIEVKQNLEYPFPINPDYTIEK